MLDMRRIGFVIVMMILILSGCADKEPIIFQQDNTGNAMPMEDKLYELGFQVNMPQESTGVTSEDYIKPLNMNANEIKWVSVVPKKPANRPLKVGFSQMEVNNVWRIYENASIFEEADRLGIDMLYRDAKSSIQKQNSDILELIAEGVDYLIIAPREYYGLRDALKAARDADIPVILIDRTADGEPGVDYVTCIMGDFFEVGQRAARILADKFPEQKIYVFEVSGTIGSSVSRDLSNGFHSVADPLGWNVVTVDGNFDRAASVKPIEAVLQSDKDKIQAVFTHVDDSAIAALQAMKAAEMKPGTDIENGEIPIVSMCGYKDAMKAIIAGEMLATIECTPKFGPTVFKYINLLEQGEAIKSRIVMPGKTYDMTNSQALINTEGY
jgi:ribose transport system substrate-binding protein